MDKKQLKNKLDEAIKGLKTTCKDTFFFDKAMDRILSLKGQIDVEPARIIVSEDSVIDDFDLGGNVHLLRCKDCIALTMTGFHIVAYPWMQTLWTHLDYLCDLHARMGDMESQEERDTAVLFTNATLSMLVMPTIAFSNDECWIALSTECVKWQTRMANDVMKDASDPENLPEDDPNALNEMRAQHEAFEDLVEEASATVAREEQERALMEQVTKASSMQGNKKRN